MLPSVLQLTQLAKQTDLSERQIERWWRLRRAQDKPSTLVKFCENTWRCLYYLYSFIFGVIVLWDKPWFWDVKSCWYGYPHQVCVGRREQEGDLIKEASACSTKLIQI